MQGTQIVRFDVQRKSWDLGIEGEENREECTITLSDGQTRTIKLEKTDICCIRLCINQEKFTCLGDYTNLESYSYFPTELPLSKIQKLAKKRLNTAFEINNIDLSDEKNLPLATITMTLHQLEENINSIKTFKILLKEDPLDDEIKEILEEKQNNIHEIMKKFDREHVIQRIIALFLEAQETA